MRWSRSARTLRNRQPTFLRKTREGWRPHRGARRAAVLTDGEFSRSGRMRKGTSMSGVTRTVAGGALLMVQAMLGGQAAAADYPTRTVSIVVPFVAGSATDVFARILADGLRNELN